MSEVKIGMALRETTEGTLELAMLEVVDGELDAVIVMGEATLDLIDEHIDCMQKVRAKVIGFNAAKRASAH